MNINVREVHKNDYDQIKDLHSKFNLNILNHDESKLSIILDLKV